MAQGDIFLKIDGIDGESKDDKHSGELDIDSFSWGVSQAGGFGTGAGGGTGKAVLQDISFTAKLSKASPILMLHCANGKHLDSATLTVRKSGEDRQEYYVVTIEDIIVSSYQVGGTDTIPMDQFTFNFAIIKFSYKPQKEDGTLDSAVEAGWDQEKNKKT